MSLHPRRLLLSLLGTSLLAVSVAACAAPPEEEAGDSDSAVRMSHRRLNDVLLLPFHYLDERGRGPDHWAFQDAARQLTTFYRGKGARVVLPGRGDLTAEPESIYTFLDRLIASRQQFDRVIFLSHGGADGPTFHRAYHQIGASWPEGATAEMKRAKVIELGEKLAAVTRQDALIYLGMCRPGQSTTWDSGGLSFIEVMACTTGRTTAGRIQKTSAEDAVTIVTGLEQGSVPSRRNFMWSNDVDQPRCTELPEPAPPPPPSPTSDAGPPAPGP